MRLRNFVANSIFFLMSFVTVAQDWHVIEKANLPEGITNNAVTGAVINGDKYVYSFAGIDSSKVYTGINLKSFRYSSSTNSWTVLPNLPDTLGKIAAGASTIDSIIYIIGGYHVFANGNEASSNKVHRFNVHTNSYLSDAANIPVAIDDHVQAVWNDSLIYVVTGWSNTRNVPNVQIYDPVNDNWLVGTSVPNNTQYNSFGTSGTIVGDTIYYYGGAAFGFNFPAQSNLRKGSINPLDPTQITWSQSVPNASLKGYRAGCTSTTSGVHWLGGSAITYNFDGIAYNGSGGVSPLNRNLYYNITTGSFDTVGLIGVSLPMDLRSLAEFNDGTRYIVGGMEANQKVSNKMLELNYVSTSIKENNRENTLKLFPNPTNSKLFIQTDVNIVDVIILDFTGKAVSFNQLNSKEISLDGLKKGCYFLQVKTDNGETLTQTLVKY